MRKKDSSGLMLMKGMLVFVMVLNTNNLLA
jgi:hypothetical protein